MASNVEKAPLHVGYKLAGYDTNAPKHPWTCLPIGNALVTMEVLGENNEHRDGVVDRNRAKFRCSEARVLSIETIDEGRAIETATSFHYDDDGNKLIYQAGETALPDRYYPNPNIVCEAGIHYYLTKNALKYPPQGYSGPFPCFNDNGRLTRTSIYQNGKEVRKMEDPPEKSSEKERAREEKKA